MGKCTKTSGPGSDGAHYVKPQEIGLRPWRAERLAELVKCLNYKIFDQKKNVLCEDTEVAETNSSM